MKKYGRIREPSPKPTQAAVINGNLRVVYEKNCRGWSIVVDEVEWHDGKLVPARMPQGVELLVVELDKNGDSVLN